MENKLGTTIEYAWDKNWSMEWNVPREIARKGKGKKMTCYDHNLLIVFDLQDPERKPLQEAFRKITLLTTKKMLTLEERLKILTDRKTRKGIIDNLASVKKELAGYKLNKSEQST